MTDTNARTDDARQVFMARRQRDRRHRVAGRPRLLDYAFYLVYVLLGMRGLLVLTGAQSGNGFARFIGAVTGPLYAPFGGRSGGLAGEAVDTAVLPIVVAIVAYALLHSLINAGRRAVGRRKAEL